MSTTIANRAACALLAASVVLGSGPAASAETAREDRADATARRTVELRLAGEATDATAVEASVRELLARLDLVVASETVTREPEDAAWTAPSGPSVLAKVVIDLRARDGVTVTVVDGRTATTRARRTIRRDGPPAVVREEVAHVVQAAVDSLRMDEATPAPTPAPAPAPAPVPAAPPPPAPAAPAPAPPPAPAPRAHGLAVDVQAAAGASTYAPSSGVVPRFGGGIALRADSARRVALGVSGAYHVPFDGPEGVATAHVRVASGRLLGGLEAFRRGDIGLEVFAGGGIDALRVEPRSAVLPEARLGPVTSRIAGVLTAGIAGHLALGDATSASLSLGVDVDPGARSWVTESDAGVRRSVFAPSHLRPFAVLAVAFTALGPGRNARR